MKTEWYTLRIKQEQKDMLKKLKEHPAESYDDVLKRLIEVWYREKARLYRMAMDIITKR